MVGVRADGLIDLHLKNQVRTALEVEPQADMIEHGLLQAFAVPLRGPAKNAREKNQHDCDDG